MRAKELTMAKKYIARDPRTGKPIQMGHATTSDASYEPIQGPWCALHHADIMSLAEGTLEKREVRWKNNTLTMSKKDGVRALSHVSQSMIFPAHALLLNAFEDEDPDVRIAALEVLPEFAVRRSNELFDWLSVLLDDEHPRVQSAASAALARAAPTFPSGVHSSLENELRHPDKQRSAAAWKGLDALGKTWPDVVADHVDTLLLEPDVTLRRRAAKMINAIVSRKTSAVWDLVSWALNDEDAQVRKTVAKSLPRLAKQDVRMGTMFAERAITDPDPDVRLSAIKTIEKLNRGHGRARDLILAGSRSTDIRGGGRASACFPNSLTKQSCVPLSTTCSKPKPTSSWSRRSCSTDLMPCLKGRRMKRTRRCHLLWPFQTLTKRCCWPRGNGLEWRRVCQGWKQNQNQTTT